MTDLYPEIEPTGNSTILILLFASKQPMPGACGSLQHFRGRLPHNFPHDLEIPYTR